MRQSGVDTLITEEPYDRIGHVRICGGGWFGNGCLYPEFTMKRSFRRLMEFVVRRCYLIGGITQIRSARLFYKSLCIRDPFG